MQPVSAKNSKAEPEHQTNRPVTGQIQVDQLKKIFPAASEDYLEKVAAELNTDLAKYKLDTPLRPVHFFAQVRQEAGARLSPKQENLGQNGGSGLTSGHELFCSASAWRVPQTPRTALDLSIKHREASGA